MSSGPRRLLVRIAPPLLIGVIPSLALSLSVARYMLAHFYVRAPYLLDSGLLSGVAYRSGLRLFPPQIACNYATSFYQVYFSPILSVISGLSYVAPVHRIEWFAFIEALVFFPFGIAVYVLASRVDPGGLVRRLPTAIIAALAFAFSGLVLWMLGYPHYEAATPGLVCLVLVAVVTGRTRLAWLFLALAASVRQDGGFHVALAVMPLVYLRWRGTAMVPSGRRLIAIVAVAIGASVAAIGCQKLLFVPVDRLGDVYLGSPPYAHLSAELLLSRAWSFLRIDPVIYYPFLATLLVALLRRDGGYLLGWVAAGPWFVFNFTAHDGAKSDFLAYAAGPFVVSVFWVYLYGALVAPASRRLRPGALELVFALICASSTLGFHRSAPSSLELTARNMAFPHARNPAAVQRFVDALRERRPGFGHLYVDYAVAALALEALQYGDSWYSGAQPPPDTLVFHDLAEGGSGVQILGDLVANQLDLCSHVVDTHIFACSHDRLPADLLAGVPVETLPSSFAFARIQRSGIVVDDRGLVIAPGARLEGRLGILARGTYEWTLALDGEPQVVAGDALEIAISVGDLPAPVAIAQRGTRELVVRLENDGRSRLWYRITPRAAAVRITGARLRRVEAH